MTKKQKIQSTASNQLKVIQDKFAKLTAVQMKINQVKKLYQEHDLIMEELLPLFITVAPDSFTIKREVTIGDKKFRYNPYFYDEKKNKVLSKIWKSTAHQSGTIA